MHCNVRALVAQAIMRSGMFRNSLPDHLLLKPEHAAAIFVVFPLSGFGIMSIRVMAVKKLNDMETAFIDIKMDIPGLKVRRTGFPDLCIRIQPLNFFPGSEANPFAVSVRADKQQIQVVVL